MSATASRKALALPLGGVIVFFAMAVIGAMVEDFVLPPSFLELPLTTPLNAAMSWFVETFGFIFKGLAWLLDWPVLWAKTCCSGCRGASLLMLSASWRIEPRALV